MTTNGSEYGERSAPCVLVAIKGVMEVMATRGIPKTSRNREQNYQYRGIEAFYAALGPAFVEHDLLVLPRVISRTQYERGTRSGGTLTVAVLEVEFDLVSSIDDSKVTVRTIGEAMDSADKASNKAMSAAWKYMAMMTFAVPVQGELDDSDATTPEQSRSYDDEPPRQERPKNQPRQSSNQLTQEGAWERYVGEMRGQRSVAELKAWANKVAPTINAWPGKWVTAFKEEYAKAMKTLREPT